MKYLPLALCICIFLSLHARGQYITTIAGTGANGYSGDNGPAINAQLSLPRDVATDLFGNLYIAEIGNNCIRKINNLGIITTVAGIAGSPGYNGDNGMATDANIANPVAISIDKFGNLYFADRANSCIRKVDVAGIITSIAGTGIAGFNGDNIMATTAQINLPNGVAIDKNGYIYISDGNNYRIRQIDTNGVISTIAGTGIAGTGADIGIATTTAIFTPMGICIDTDFNVFFTDHSRIKKINSSGMMTIVAGGGSGPLGDGGPATAATMVPEGIKVDKYGQIYLADEGNGRIRFITASGIITTIAGVGNITGPLGDGGPASIATILSPTGIALDTSGMIYIADQQHSRIRKLYEHTVDIPDTEMPIQCSISPNPSKGTFTLQWPTVQPHTRVLVINIAGQVIKTVSADNVQQVTISLSEPDGIYYLQSTTPTATNAAQIIVQR